MSAARLAWPGFALALTFVDDVVAGPLLAATGAWVGGAAGVALGVAAFTVFVGALVASVVLTGSELRPATRKKIDDAVTKASRRRFVGRFVSRVGDRHPWSTAVVAAVISPVFAVLLARLVHPAQTLRRTGVVAALAYGLVFSLAYTGAGAGLGGLVA